MLDEMPELTLVKEMAPREQGRSGYHRSSITDDIIEAIVRWDESGDEGYLMADLGNESDAANFYQNVARVCRCGELRRKTRNVYDARKRGTRVYIRRVRPRTYI